MKAAGDSTYWFETVESPAGICHIRGTMILSRLILKT